MFSSSAVVAVVAADQDTQTMETVAAVVAVAAALSTQRHQFHFLQVVCSRSPSATVALVGRQTTSMEDSAHPARRVKVVRCRRADSPP